MFIYTASEIIRNAEFLANVRNSDLLDFHSKTLLLNEEYNSLYNDIIRETRQFTAEYEFEGNSTTLPDDCYILYDVKVGKRNIEPCPTGQYVPGTYKLENNVLTILGSMQGPYTITYAPMPITITAPDEMVETTIPEGSTFLYVDEDYIYYTYNSTNYKYEIATGEITTDSQTRTISTYTNYLGGILDWSDLTAITFTKDGATTDVTDYFTRDNETITNIAASEPYLMVSYRNNNTNMYSVYLFTGFDGAEWNPLISTGKNTYGYVVLLNADDTTGKGCVFYNQTTSTYYYCSFVPDTVLEYPTQTFFTLLEYRIAAKLCMLTGQEPGYLLNDMLEKAENQFYLTLAKDEGKGTRVKNINSYRRFR